jgi:Secretion system C-terminal sorting domain
MDMSSNKYLRFNSSPIVGVSLAKPYYCSQNPSKPADKQISLLIKIETNSVNGISNTGIKYYQALPPTMVVNVKITTSPSGKSFAQKDNVVLKLIDSKLGTYEGVGVLDVTTTNRIDNSVMLVTIAATDLTTKNHFLLQDNLTVPIVSLAYSKDYKYDKSDCTPTIANGDIFAETITVETFGGTGYSCTGKRVLPILDKASKVNFFATSSIQFKPTTHFQVGSIVAAQIISPPFFIDCAQKLVQVEERQVQVPTPPIPDNSVINATDMNISPNPVSNIVTIDYELQLSEPQPISLRLYDITGRLVRVVIDNEPHSSGHYYKVLDESELSQGIYFYQLQVGNQKIIKKIVKM